MWLVLGANGLLGQAVVRALVAAGEEFRGLTRSDFDFSGEVDWTRLGEFIAASDIVVNCAGFSNVDQAEREPGAAKLINAELPGQLAELCRTAGKRVVQISTGYVFDGEQTAPYRVDDVPNPIQHYGLTKLQAEHAVSVQVVAGLKAAVVRTGWLYGAQGEQPNNDLPNRLAGRLIAGEEVLVTGQFGAPTYVGELADFILRLGRAEDHDFIGTHHAIASGSVSWYEFALSIAETLGISPELVVKVRTDAEVGSGANNSPRAKRPVNGLLVPSDIAGYRIADWAIGWQRYLPEFRRRWGR